MESEITYLHVFMNQIDYVENYHCSVCSPLMTVAVAIWQCFVQLFFWVYNYGYVYDYGRV